MKLLVQPEDGVSPLVKAIERAKKTVDILIFRFDRPELERALLEAVGRGVRVRALIAYTNRGGERHLRELEMRLLAAGITIGRTADDLLRYHGKMMIVDGHELYLLAFNFTYVDMDHCRSFGLCITNRKLVLEAVRLFEADLQRKTYVPGAAGFVVSPVNAREELSAFIKAAKKELLIYDPDISDAAMVRQLAQRAEEGVAVRILGRAKLPARRLVTMRLHARAMVRDGLYVFLGSQSLRRAELDQRREIGVMIRDVKIAGRLVKIFNQDWETGQPRDAAAPGEAVPARKIAKKVAKAVTKDLPPVATVLAAAVKEVAADGMDVPLNSDHLQDAVEDAVKHAVKEAVRTVVEDATAPHPSVKT